VNRKYKIVTQTKDHKTIIAVDIDEPDIMEYLRSPLRHKNKFIDIAKVILGRLSNRQLYKWEKIDKDHTNVWAMRFFVGQENDRIYCQEVFEGDRKIVIMAALHLSKKERENTEREVSVIKTVSKYVYEKQENNNGENKKS
jgi:hypothetical protein